MVLHASLIRRFFSQLLIEFGPIVLFIFIFELKGFLLATKCFIATTLYSLIFSYVKEGRIPIFPLFAGVMTFFFGGLTLFFHDPSFLMFRDTLYDAFFGTMIAIGLVQNKFILKTFFHKLVSLSEKGWYILSRNWMLFFYIAALGNEIARHHLHTSEWVIYKSVITVVTGMYGFLQLYVVRSHFIKKEE